MAGPEKPADKPEPPKEAEKEAPKGMGLVEQLRDGAAAKPAPEAEQPHRSTQYMTEMWNEAVAANGGKPLSVVKGYYEAGVRKVDSAEHPNGLLLSSTESPMKLKSDVTVRYPDGSSETLKAGTELPNGYQIAPKNPLSEAEMAGKQQSHDMQGATLIKTGPKGEVIKAGEINESFSFEKGQFAKPDSYVVSRPSVDLETGKARIDTYTNKDTSRWVPVEGQPGVFSPKLEGAQPAGVIKVPEGKGGTFDVSYGGTAPFQPGDLIVQEEKTLDSGEKVPAYRRISQGDGLETYLPADAASRKALDESAQAISEKYPGVKITRAAADAETFRAQAAKPAEVAFADLFKPKPADAPKAAAGAEPTVKSLDFGAAVAGAAPKAGDAGQPEEVRRVRAALANLNLDDHQRQMAEEETARLAAMPKAEREAIIREVRDMAAKGQMKDVIDHNIAPRSSRWSSMLYLTGPALDAVASAFGM